MKDKFKALIKEAVFSWSDPDIYAISLFVYDENDNPCRPTVTLGYNTEEQYRDSLDLTDEKEARWNYAFWLQNQELYFGAGDSADDIRLWLEAKGLPFYDDNEVLSDESYRDLERVTHLFVDELIAVVRELHAEKFLTSKFGRELPVIIHELEYYDEIAEQNIQANGELLDKSFIDFCTGG